MKDICVTGAGQGLGKAIATRLIDDGYRVVAVDVQADRLKELTAPNNPSAFTEFQPMQNCYRGPLDQIALHFEATPLP